VSQKRLPSVTTVLGVLNKPALLAWANRVGLEGKTLREASDPLADVGTDLHELCSASLAGRPTSPLKCQDPVHLEMLTNAYSRFITWRDSHRIRPIIAETPLVSNHGFGGTLDFFGEIDDSPLVVDFKTAKAIYSEHCYQVSAYVHLARENGYHASGAMIVRVGRDEGEGFDFRPMHETEISAGWEIFKHCLWIYRALQHFDKDEFTEVLNL